jgi:hypothetical protein
VESLIAALRQLCDLVARFAPTRPHLVPDIALLGFLKDVEENSRAVLLFADTPLRHRAYPSARAAFEAAQLALLLVTDSEYDLAGARAWIYYLRRDRDFASQPRDGDAVTIQGLTPNAWFREAVDEIAEMWESFSPRKGQLIAEAERLVMQQPKRPDNWAGVPIARTLSDRMSALAQRTDRPISADAAKAYNNAYAALTRQSHPRTQLRPEEIRSTAGQEVSVRFEVPDFDEQYENAVSLTAGAVLHALAALRARIAMPAV